MTDKVTDSSEMESEFNRFDGESQSGKLTRKIQENPIFPISIAGCAAVVAYGAYTFKNRGAMSTSVYLMQFRVAAQGTVVACLTAGLLYSMAKRYVFNIDKKKE